MRLLITGKNGQLGWELQQVATKHPEHTFFFADSTEGDITNKHIIASLVEAYKIECIINCAAYTAVDKAEEDYENAFTVNHTGVQNLVDVCAETGIALIHISTDYVFDGSASTPYLPKDPVSPLGVYGQSKRHGEEAILKSEIRSVILRTSWVYSSHGNNFVKTMLRLGAERDTLNVVSDQKGCPTYARDLAEACLTVVDQLSSLEGPEVHHFSNRGAITWFDFATEIMRLAHLNCTVHPITSAEYPTPAARPNYSVLSTESFTQRFGQTPAAWQDSLKACISALGF